MTERSRSLLLLASVAVVCVALLEVGLRIALAPPVLWRYPQEHYVSDPEMAYRLEPDQAAFTMNESVTTNRLGLRDRAPEPRRRDQLRILAMGDSQTFGVGLASGDAWPKQLEAKLRSELRGCPIEVVNAGLPASATWHQGVLLDRLLPIYTPDLVVVALYVNDVTETAGRAPFALEGRPDWVTKLVYALKRSAVVTATLHAWRSVRSPLEPPDVNYELSVIRGVSEEETDPGWRQVETSLARMARQSRASGAELLLLVLPRIDQVTGAEAGLGYQEHAARIATSIGVDFVDPLPILRSHLQEPEPLTLAWDGHYSALGDRAIASATASAILDRGVLSGLIADRCAGAGRTR